MENNKEIKLEDIEAELKILEQRIYETAKRVKEISSIICDKKAEEIDDIVMSN